MINETDHPFTHPMQPIIAAQTELIEYFSDIVLHDPLTGLLNKAAWEQDIEDRIASNKAFGSIFLDIDSFKRVNDTFGHEVGDELIVSVGKFLQKRFVRSTDSLSHETIPMIAHSSASGNRVARWAGDEFGINVGFESNQSTAVNDAPERRAQTIQERLASESTYVQRVIDEYIATLPEEIRNLDVNISFGAVLWDPANPETKEQLFAKADAAMLEHKGDTKQNVHNALPWNKKLAAKFGNGLLRYAGVSTPR